jgi:hypothetical protein
VTFRCRLSTLPAFKPIWTLLSGFFVRRLTSAATRGRLRRGGVWPTCSRCESDARGASRGPDRVRRRQIGDVQLLGEGGGVPESTGGELGTGLQDALDDHGKNQIALSAGAAGQKRVELEESDGVEEGLDATVGERGGDTESLVGRQQQFTAEDASEKVDFPSGQGRQIGKVQLLTFPFSRWLSRRRKAGDELRLGTSAMYMPTLLCRLLAEWEGIDFALYAYNLHFKTQPEPLAKRLSVNPRGRTSA